MTLFISSSLPVLLLISNRSDNQQLNFRRCHSRVPGVRHQETGVTDGSNSDRSSGPHRCGCWCFLYGIDGHHRGRFIDLPEEVSGARPKDHVSTWPNSYAPYVTLYSIPDIIITLVMHTACQPTYDYNRTV